MLFLYYKHIIHPEYDQTKKQRHFKILTTMISKSVIEVAYISDGMVVELLYDTNNRGYKLD